MITAEELEDRLAADIRDVVKLEPGVSVRSSPARFGAALGATAATATPPSTSAAWKAAAC